jgi:hypothetical protein
MPECGFGVKQALSRITLFQGLRAFQADLSSLLVRKSGIGTNLIWDWLNLVLNFRISYNLKNHSKNAKC